MNTETLYVIKITLWVIAAIAGILAAWFEFRDRWQNEIDRVKTRQFYGRLWQVIQNSGLLVLPEKVIQVLLIYRKRLMRFILVQADKSIKKIARPYWDLAVLFLIISSSFTTAYQILGTVYGIILIIPWLSFALVAVLNRKFNFHTPLFVDQILQAALLLSSLVTSILILSLILNLSTLVATIVLTALAPILGLFVAVALVFLAILIIDFFDIDMTDTFGNFGVSVGFSFSITMVSLLVGSFANPNSWIPQTIQMFLSNVFCDGMTVYTTIFLLQLVVSQNSKITIPIMIFIDLIVAGFLACASLYFGLLGTEKAISLLGCLHTLIGLSPSGEAFELGPYFWAMHTTFLPTLLYLSIILFCWFGKMLIIPIAKLISRGSVVEKPHHLTAGAFALIAVVFGVLATGVGHFEDAANKREAELTKVTMSEVRDFE